MYNLDNVVRMYFSAVSSISVIKDKVKYDEFSQQEFGRLSKAYLLYYSDTEDRQLYEYIADSVLEEGHPFSGMDDRSGLNVFAALEELAEQLLTFENGEVLCIYHNLLRFRNITKYVEEDLLVCAYLAMRFRRFGRLHSDFGWNTSIGHNNVQLRRIMEREISENHFHLYGSAPSFHLLWIYFMNHVDGDALAVFAGELQKKQRVIREHYNIEYSEDSFVARVLKAALMRVEIVSYLLRNEMLEEGAAAEDSKASGEDEAYEKCDEVSWLTNEEDILVHYSEIQKKIDRIRNLALLTGKGELTDYALWSVENLFTVESEHSWFAGERWIMYNMLLGELRGEAGKLSVRKYYQWFYAYLVIKQNVRSEIIQVNDTVGFENFAIYNARKNVYVDYEKMIEAAVYGSVERGNIRFLEMRITPSKRAYDIAKMLLDIDGVIQRRQNPLPKSAYYYVFHFPKEKEEPLEERRYFDGIHCRHYKKRKQLEQQANEIVYFRENYRATASEVLGIDACAQEIGCRPEVFAPIFRYLSNHIVEKITGLEEIEVSQLRMTYHVGEDFLDVVDGLRAVDEAIHFLNLKCGDRIGHGTVLGINVKDWYEFKHNTIIIKRQDYLDNIVWLYNKLNEYKIAGFETLREKLLEEFEFYFAEIFLHMEDGTNRDLFYYNIHAYYEAWKLRGDEPELYLGGYYERKRIYGRDWLVNRVYPEKFETRLRHEVGYLYYLYHYDWNVRKNGERSVQIYVPPMYVEGVCAVQMAMQREFSSRGIGVETNPSSNLAISTINNYDEHPIVVMYNKDMTSDAEKLGACPQINVSINTDDKGVFHTSLENEYALMACAMEKVKDSKGNNLYNRQMIYQWIDNIREMGNLQSFRESR